MSAVILGSYREFLATVSASAGALTGLLFVAMSVAPRRERDARPAVIQQVRAAAALLAFVNSLAVSLFALVPGSNIGYPAVVLGVIGILFTAAGMRSIFASPATLGQRRRQIGLINLLLLIFGTELVAGLALLAEPRRSTPLQIISDALVASLLVGIARAWELVGDRDTGIIASIAVLTHHGPPRPASGPAAEGAGAAAAGDAPGPEPSDHDAGERPGQA